MAPAREEGATSDPERLGERHAAETETGREDPRAEARRHQRRRLSELLDRSATFYANYLWDSREASGARRYLQGRGFGEETLRAFGIGYAPEAWDKLLLGGLQAGFRIEELRAVGLIQQGRSGSEYDRFRSRIIFPIRDREGRTLGFGGRAIRSDEEAKYVNTAETDFFHKGETLYGIDLAQEAIAETRQVIVVEGYTDAVALHQAGFRNAVGLMGVAFTEAHIAELSDIADEIVLALDPDTTGQEATLRARRIAADRRIQVRAATLPSGEDPAEILAVEGGVERLQALLELA